MPKKVLFLSIIIFSAIFFWLFFFNKTNDINLILPAIKTISKAKPSKPLTEEEVLALLFKSAKQLPDFPPPEKVKAIYVTAYTASSPESMNKLIDLTKTTDINAMVINVKDSDHTFIKPWMGRLVQKLRQLGIYPIARVVLFQDNELAQKRTDLAIKGPDGKIWGKKGYHWVDPSSKEVWDANIAAARKAIDLGFLEINFDYVRFPDGNVNDLVYPFYNHERLKKDVINDAAQYINGKIKETHPEAITSLDIFAYALLRNDIGIGQKFTDLVNYFDVIAPMIYPSHYAAGNFGYQNPATEPYQVVFQTLQSGNWQLKNASTTAIIRPWIQDFDLGAVYNREKIIDQIRATADSRNNSGWMVWNPSNQYQLSKYENIDLAVSTAESPTSSIEVRLR